MSMLMIYNTTIILMNQKGFTFLIALFIIALVLGTGSILGAPYIERAILNNSTPLPSPTAITNNGDSGSDSSNFLNTQTPKANPQVTKTPTKTILPTSKPSSPPSSGTTCSYNLNSATGAVKINFQPQTGYLVSSIKGELKATSGCKVLDGKSTDTLERYGSVSTKEVIFNSVPPGVYSVRYSFASSWGNSQTVTVSSGGLVTVNASIAGDTVPTPTPAPLKPQCSVPIAAPSQNGTAPLNVSLYLGYIPNSTYVGSDQLKYIQWDLTGDGSWDITTGYGYPYAYTYQTSGTYTLKGRLQAANGDYSDPCQLTITVGSTKI
jgi:hypothetical protein